MTDSLIDTIIDISTMSGAALTTFAKLSEPLSESEILYFAEKWTAEIEKRLTIIRQLGKLN